MAILKLMKGVNAVFIMTFRRKIPTGGKLEGLKFWDNFVMEMTEEFYRKSGTLTGG